MVCRTSQTSAAAPHAGSLRARICESESDISGFPQHGYFSPTHPLCPPTFPPTLFRELLVSHGTIQDHQALKKSFTAVGLGRSKTFQDLLRTERVGFEPTRVLPLHDFESCAINRTLPPLHTPSGVPRSLKADEPGTCSMLQKPTALGCGRLKPQPGSGDQLPGF